ncbi:MAG: cellulase family glycosylhydrolase [Terracidiphilus sp.]
MRFYISCLAALIALAVPAAAQDRGAEARTAFTRAQHLKRGINASEWFAQRHDYPAEYTDRYTDAGDIALMAKLGFDHVRLSVDPMPLEISMNGDQGRTGDFLARLDRAVDTMLADGLAAIIDVHPSDDYKQRMRTDNEAVERFAMLWRKLAAHYAGRDPNMVFFEILNEPEMNDPYRWYGIQTRVAAAIREAAPKNTIIAAGANWSDLPDLLAMTPLAVVEHHAFHPVSGGGELDAGAIEGGSRCGRALRVGALLAGWVERASHPADDRRGGGVGSRQPCAADLR